MTTIEYLSALPGAGKTRQLVEEAKRKAIEGVVLFSFRSKASIDEVYKTYFFDKSPYYEAHVEVSGDDPEEGPVTSRIAQRLTARKASAPKGLILLITHKALFMLRYRELLKGTHVIIDEIPSPTNDWELPSGSQCPLLGLLDADQDTAKGLILLKPRKPHGKALKELRRAKERPAERDVAWNLSSFWFDTLTTPQDFEKRNSTSMDEKVHVFSRLRYEPFSACDSVVVGGAHFENSLFFLYGQKQNVVFKQRLDLKSRLQFTEPKTGWNATICYAHCGDWSSSLRDEKIDESTVVEHVANKVEDFFGEREFLYSVNKAVERDGLFQNPNAIRLPHVAHGLNCFSHVDNVAYLSATNPKPWVSGFHKANGLSSIQVKRAIYFENVVQAVYRMSIRVLGSQSPKIIIVIDEWAAKELQSELEGATVVCMSWIPEDVGIRKKPGRKSIHMDAAQRSYVFRQNQKKCELVAGLHEVTTSEVSARTETIARAMNFEMRNEIDIDCYKDIVTDFYVMQFNNKRAKEPYGTVWCSNNDEFIEFLRNLHQHTWRDKKNGALTLISPSFYDKGQSQETDRGNENVAFSRGIFLDNDGGALSYVDFANLFPNLRIAVFNSSSSNSELVKWRAYIPTTGPISPEAYKFIVEQMFTMISAAGYHPPTAKIEPSDGFDRTRKGPASLFFAPCQALDPEDSFFIDFHGDRRQDLDALNWIEQYYDEMDGQDVVESWDHSGSEEGRNEAAIASAREYWRANVRPGNGNDEFLNLGLKLASAGVLAAEMGGILLEEHHFAPTAESRRDRRRQTPYVIKTLRNFGHLKG